MKKKSSLKKIWNEFSFFANTGPKGKAVKYLSDIHKGKYGLLMIVPIK